MKLKPKVALAQDFLVSMSKIPQKVQSQIIKWSVQFQSNPAASGINYEKITMCRDPNLRSIRINQDWRGIVFKPVKGNIYVLLYVDHHDDAYRWAKNRKISVNPVTGSLQVILSEEVSETLPDEKNDSQKAILEETKKSVETSEKSALFAELSDHDLLSLGTPEDLIKKVREVTTEKELDNIETLLPIEAYEGLFLVAAGDTVEQVIASREVFMPEKVDIEDFDKALETPESQSRFFIVKDDEALIAAMNASLEHWRIFLHPSQKRFAVSDRNGPIRILGGAGTGKTVVALHRAAFLAENHTQNEQKVLFTTFTKNLAIDIEQNLKKLCTPNLLKKIEIINLDAWVYRFLRKQKYEHSIIFNYKKNPTALAAWEKAMAIRDTSIQGLDETFYREEWENIIQSQGITDLESYLKARRVGRKSLLNRKKRLAVWPIFNEYRVQLSLNRLKEVDDAYRDAAELLKDPEIKTMYSSIVIDESQDFGTQALKLLRAIIPEGKNDLFFVGDGHQRIYKRNQAVMGQCGINIRGRGRKLYLNYRTTDEIRNYALGILSGREIDDLDGGIDENKRYKSLSHGPKPQIVKTSDLESASNLIPKILKDWETDHKGDFYPKTCVMVSKNKILESLKTHFEQTELNCTAIKHDQPDESKQEILRLSTMHRSKGLEFDQVIVIFDGTLPLEADEEDNTPNLIYVSLTRARRRAALIEISSQ